MPDEDTVEIWTERNGVEMSIILCATCGSDDPGHDATHGRIHYGHHWTPVANVIDEVEKIMHPDGRCADCGGGVNYWKHRGDAKQHDFVPLVDTLLDKLELCDDCRQAYPGPAYYTFDPEDCGAANPHACTGNSCPACCGPYLTPDNPDDERRPIEP